MPQGDRLKLFSCWLERGPCSATREVASEGIHAFVDSSPGHWAKGGRTVSDEN